MENDIDAIYEVEIKFHVQILQREDMLITYISKTRPMVVVYVI